MRRVLRPISIGAITGFVAAMILGGPVATPASATTVSVDSEAELRSAFEGPDVSQIDLTGDITIKGDDCINATFIRQSETALTVDGHGFSVTQTCDLQVFQQVSRGAMTFENITISGGQTGSPGGGAIGTADSVTIASSTLRGNQSSVGGGAIAADFDVTIVDSTLADNESTGTGLLEYGGAINAGGTVTVNRSTLSGNSSALAGGAVVAAGKVTIVNSTVTGNKATTEGGGILGFGGVGLVYATVAGNSVPADGHGADVAAPDAPFEPFGSVIAEAQGAPSCFFGDGTPSSNGYNYGDDGSCGLTAPTDVNDGGSPELGPLAANGGPTLTLLPQPGSPLLGAIPTDSCQADGAVGIVTDQRGDPRSGTSCDIGSVQVSGANEPPPPSDGEPGFAPDVIAGFQDILELFGDVHVPGTVLGVSVPGQGRFLGVNGTAGIDDPTPLRPDMRFRIGSVTKTFTATAALMLVDECKLRLDDTIERWQPKLPEASHITVRELLNHTSGVPDFSDNPRITNELERHPLREHPPQTLVDGSFTLPRAFAPGAAWEYSNTNYFILGLIVEDLTGQPLEQFIQRRILDPLHLDATSFPTTPAIPQPATSGALVEIDDDLNVLSEQPFNLSPSYVWAAGAMVSDLADLETWVRALVDGTLLSPETQRARLTLVPMVGPEVPDGTVFEPIGGTTGPSLTAQYGLGLFAMGGFIGHNGDIPGYEAVMMYDPNTGTLVVELQNARLSEQDQALNPPEMDLLLPSSSVPTIAGILGQDPPLPPNPTGPTAPPCAPPGPPGPPPPSPPATPVVGRPTFTA